MTPTQGPDRSTMPVWPQRLAPIEESDWDDEATELIERSGRLNIFATMARHPKALRRWTVFGSHVMLKSTLADRDRELVILRVGWRCGSDYEFGQHTLIGRNAGLSDDEIRRVTVEELDGWAPEDELLLRAADEVVDDHRLGDETWAALTQRFDTKQVIDLILTAGQYMLVSCLLNSFGVQRDEGVPGWPE